MNDRDWYWDESPKPIPKGFDIERLKEIARIYNVDCFKYENKDFFRAFFIKPFNCAFRFNTGYFYRLCIYKGIITETK